MQSERSSIEIQAPDPPFWTKTSWLQLGYGVWVNMTVMGIGLSFGFPAVTIPQLRDEESSIKITLSDEAWIVSVLTLSSPIGSLLCGILMDRYGRKIVLVLCEIPMCFGWFYTGCAASARDIIIGRGIAGIGLGMAITAPRAYITEITLPNMRGVIGALPNLFISLGLCIQAGFGSFLAWTTLCYICGCYAVIMMFSNIFLPDTPYFLLLQATGSSRANHAKSNLRMFRSSKFNVDAELEALYDFRNENNIRSLSFKDQLKALFRPSSCKPYGIVTTYIIFMQLAGVNVVIMWAVEMLQTAKSSTNAHLGNFILALTRIVVGFATSVLLFKVGRRVMAMISAIGVGVVAIGLCIFLYANNEKSAIPLLLFMAYISFATLGYYTLPFLMMFELLPLQLRGLLSGICVSQLNLLMFAMNNCYPFIRQQFGLANTMAMFGVFSLIGAIVLYFILPETKDLTLQEIEEFFNSRRSTLVSQRQVMSDQLMESRISLKNTKSNLNMRRSSDKDSKRRGSKDKRMDKKSPNEEDLKYKTTESKTNQKDMEETLKIIEKSGSQNAQKLEHAKDVMGNPTGLKENKQDLIENESNLKVADISLENEEKNLVEDNVFKDDGKNTKEIDLKIEEIDLKDKKKDLKDEEINLKDMKKDSKEVDLKDKEIDLKNDKIELLKEEELKDEEIDLKNKNKDFIEMDLKNDQNNLSIDKENNLKELEKTIKDSKSIDSKVSKDSKTSEDSKKVEPKKPAQSPVKFKKTDD